MTDTVSSYDVMKMGPYLVMLAGPVLLMIIIALKRNHMIAWLFTLAIFLLTFILSLSGMDNIVSVPLFAIDKFSLFYSL